MSAVSSVETGIAERKSAAGTIAFITGCGRSGTTILGSILAKHPEVSYLNDRFDLWIRPFAVTDIWGRRYGSEKASPRIELTAADAEGLTQRERDRFQELLALESRGHRVLVEKLAINNFRMGFLAALCPDAAIINIVRHGVEVAYSIDQRVQSGRWYGEDDRKWKLLVEHARSHRQEELPPLCRTPLERGLLEWRLSVDAADRYLASQPPRRLLRLRYEDLIEDPLGVCQNLEALLGLSPSKEMREFAKAEVRRRTPSFATRPVPERAAAIAGPTLARHGYMLGGRGGARRGVKDKYFFGRTPTRQIDVFAFPRTGSHLFRYCTAGLFDLVALPQPGLDNPEAIDRQAELNPNALYALDLREDGVTFSPVWFNTRSTGQHGFPVKGEAPMVVLIRDPIPTLYSFYRVSIDRWRQPIDDPPTWIRAKCQRYSAFYDAGFEQIAKSPRDSLLIRYEERISSAEPLRRLAALVGVQPKLDPEFVHSVTKFDQFTRRGTRTFYRAGDNNAWRHDKEWCAHVERADLPDLSRFVCPAS